LVKAARHRKVWRATINPPWGRTVVRRGCFQGGNGYFGVFEP
jgi:hypothetical protein